MTKSHEPKNPPEERLIPGEDFYFDERDRMVLTRAYHLKRGYCCKNICRHFPYGYPEEVAQALKKNEVNEGTITPSSPVPAVALANNSLFSWRKRVIP